jgi:hypothetical protein
VLLTVFYAPSSTIIREIELERISNTESAYMAYFFFDFNDTGKQDAGALLASVLVQLSSQSASFCNILLEFYLAYQHGSKKPSESDLFTCLGKMLRVPGTVPIYFIIDALDECPDASESQSPRAKVLELLEQLVGFQLPNLRLCVASRFEDDIRNVIEPLTSTCNRISLHDEDGQKRDIADYVRSVVKTMKWREEDKELVIRALSIRNGKVYVSLLSAHKTFSHLKTGFVGFHVRLKPYAAVSRPACNVLLRSCLKPWTRRMSGYYRVSPESTECTLIDS